jgi:hypothetical protein
LNEHSTYIYYRKPSNEEEGEGCTTALIRKQTIAPALRLNEL